MYRYYKHDPDLEEAHARTQEAMHELDAAIAEAFGRYDQLVKRLDAFDAHLRAARVKCHVEPIGDRQSALDSGSRRDRAQAATTRGIDRKFGGHPLSGLPAPA
jgi:hypothetical protein